MAPGKSTGFFIMIGQKQGTPGPDLITGDKGVDFLEGLAGNDTLLGSPGADILSGGDGYDTVSYETSAAAVSINLATSIGQNGDADSDTYVDIECVIGSIYNDNLTGDHKANYLAGGAGNDVLIGRQGIDTLDGGVGDDSYHVSDDDLIIEHVGGGHDKIFASTNFTLALDAEIEELFAVGARPTTLSGSNHANTFYGNDHSNTFVGLSGNDTYYCAAGDVVIEASQGGYDIVYAETGFALGLEEEIEELVLSSSNTADLQGSNTNNKIVGNGVQNSLWGFGGNDTILGAAGKDIISGGKGNDKIYGGLDADQLAGGRGKDLFIFDTPPNKKSVDRVMDFNVKDDSIWLENKIYTVGGKGSEKKPVKIKKDLFQVGTKAADAEDRVIYDKKAGVLYYDVDGTGSAVQVKIATLTKNLSITYSDFYVI
ncbi:calcium-binding protein [Microvirga sp. CF3062]|uniref:calcium-binding protein n=1 Tax=Microvirga sp. CF3062 TaxID=3110182 RepID=UPI002E78080D|nr:calcium-binding protein [Microvirga sp. CF3062]MEE1656933.1 calcium-binding protein [Microvirga sp. CF3062]